METKKQLKAIFCGAVAALFSLPILSVAFQTEKPSIKSILLEMNTYTESNVGDPDAVCNPL